MKKLMLTLLLVILALLVTGCVETTYEEPENETVYKEINNFSEEEVESYSPSDNFSRDEVEPDYIPTTKAPPDTHVDNPFANATWYINPDWSKKALKGGGSAIANYSTAIWIDRIKTITAGKGLQGHLDEALSQEANLIMIVIYNLPNRDCASLASSGELWVAEAGLRRYKAQYIDRIVSIMVKPKYKNLSIVTIIEPDSLPNLVTNLDIPRCREARDAYIEGIQHTINSLHRLPNTYIYLDIAHSGWLGWEGNFAPAVDLYTKTLLNTSDGLNSIDGFITNTANYVPTEEPYLADPEQPISYQEIKSADFYGWNPYFDELDYAQALYNAFVSQGFSPDIGMLIDTSRNGWGGVNRPTDVSTSTNLNIYINESRIDQRLHRGNWCNQLGGIGERPQANPAPHIDAFVWVKPPGESDGISKPDIIDPDDPNKKHDPLCNPNGTNPWGNTSTGAMENAPHSGRWFQEQFEILLQNAYPALQPE